MKRRIVFSLIVLGVSAVIAQVLLVRELMIVFYGNEFFVGWTLFSWLFWVGAGCLLFGRALRFTTRLPATLAISHAAAAVLLPAELALVRAGRALAGPVAGQAPDLLPSLASTFLSLAPLCLTLAALFISAAKSWKLLGGDKPLGLLLGRAYVYETVGFVIGGTLFGYLLVTEDEFSVAAMVQWLNVAACAALYASPHVRSFIVRLALVAAAAAATVTTVAAPRMNIATQRYLFPGQKLVDTRNSIHGSVAVAHRAGQYSFYQNGLLSGSEEDALWNEQLVHLPLLCHPAPRRVLLIGGGLTGALNEILKHAPERVDYLELDPALIETSRAFLTPEQRAALGDPRVQILPLDGRLYLNRLAGSPEGPVYDAIIVNLPNPSTILINRLYTLEFFELAKASLRPGGIFSTHLAFAPDYISPEMETLGASVHRTLAAAFKSVIVLPEYAAFFIASADAELAYDPAPLVERLAQRGIRTAYLSAAFIEYRLTTDRNARALDAFARNRDAQVNRDLVPVACHYQLACWVSSLHPRAARWLAAAGRIRPWHIASVLPVVFGIVLFRARRRPAGGSLWAMGTASFTLMACELAIVLGFQIFYGYLYYRISLIVACLMLGMAAGSWTASHLHGPVRRGTLARLHFLLAAYAAALLALFRTVGPLAQQHPVAFQALFLALAATLGAIVGFEFPTANKVLLAARGEDHRRAGAVYAVDLLGSCAGALLISVVLLPVLGVAQTLGALAALNATLAVAMAVRRVTP